MFINRKRNPSNKLFLNSLVNNYHSFLTTKPFHFPYSVFLHREHNNLLFIHTIHKIPPKIIWVNSIQLENTVFSPHSFCYLLYGCTICSTWFQFPQKLKCDLYDDIRMLIKPLNLNKCLSWTTNFLRFKSLKLSWENCSLDCRYYLWKSNWWIYLLSCRTIVGFE